MEYHVRQEQYDTSHNRQLQALEIKTVTLTAAYLTKNANSLTFTTTSGITKESNTVPTLYSLGPRVES